MCRGGSSGETLRLHPPFKKKNKQLHVNNNYLKMYRNIIIFIENTRVIAFSIFIIINQRPYNIKPINSDFNGNTILVISTTVAVSVTKLTSDRFNRNK
jgi:hypothetical protein